MSPEILMRRVRQFLSFGIVLALVFILPYVMPLPGAPGQPAEALAWPEGVFVTAGGSRTFVETAGPRDGPVVVLIHGFGGSTYSWRHTLPALAAAGYRGVALDLKGFGLADKRFETDYSHPAQAAFVAAVMDALGVQRAAIVGHSMGGSVAAHFALAYPDRTAALVLVDAALFETGSRFNAGAVFNFPPARQWGRVILRGLLTPERVTESLRTAYYDPAFVTPAVADGYGVPQKVSNWDLALMGVMRDSGRNALPQPLSAVRAPALVLWGENDTWVPLAQGQQLTSQIPGAQRTTFPRSGHLPMEEQADAFNARLVEFLKAQTAP